jgi:hypothetical protein
VCVWLQEVKALRESWLEETGRRGKPSPPLVSIPLRRLEHGTPQGEPYAHVPVWSFQTKEERPAFESVACMHVACVCKPTIHLNLSLFCVDTKKVPF